MIRTFRGGLVVCAALASILPTAAASEDGIPVTNPLVIAKCGSCHAKDEYGNLERISWMRTTPEGWQEVLKRMVLANNLVITPQEARSLVRYLSASHGLAPDEARPILYEVERRIREETNIPSENLIQNCTRCHSFARALSWRRSTDEWKKFLDAHTTRYKTKDRGESFTFLSKAAPLHTPEWDSWKAQTTSPDVTGRWLATASVTGHGKFYGEMRVESTGEGEYTTTVRLTSLNDGSTIVRSGRGAIFAGYAWRGRSKGAEAADGPDALTNEAREALWFAPDHTNAEGRWFWGQYQEFGFDVKLRRPSSTPTLFILDQPALKTGSQAVRVRIIGDALPANPAASDLSFGSGVTVKRIVSHTPSEVVAEVDVAPDARPGRRDVALGGSVLTGAIAIYDRVDYIKITPESSLAAFGNPARPRGYQQFDAVGYQNGPDGRAHTADDIELGPVDVNWSLEVFYASKSASSDIVGKISPTGFFTPLVNGPSSNFDVWVSGTAKNEKNKKGVPLVGKAYLVVTVPTYSFNGRRFVRDLDRWVDDGPATEKDKK